MLSGINVNPSQTLIDVTDDYYIEMRKPRLVLFFANGNSRYPGKLLSITPNRYFIFNELLDELTKYFEKEIFSGVRKIYNKDGRQITDLNDLEHDKFYICSSSIPFHPLNYEEKYYEFINKGK